MTKEKFNSLPKEIREKATDTLKAYDKVYINYENGAYRVSTGVALTATYAPDHKTIGTVTKEEIFTDEEMIINYAESFHDYPANYKGKRDYSIFKGVDWNTKYKIVDGNIVKA